LTVRLPKTMEQIAILNENIKIFNCSICAEKFGQKSDLLRHIKIIHEKIKDFECSICTEKFGQK